MLFRINEVKKYSFSEFKEIRENRELMESELKTVDKIIGYIHDNKVMYTQLVFTTALFLSCNTTFTFAESFSSLDAPFEQLIELIKDFAKWGCLGLGLKKTTEEMLAGANFKQASTSGIQYWLAYIFIQFYPRLFDMIKL